MGNNLENIKIDKIDMDIIRYLWNGRTPFSTIAKKLGIATNTVRSRVERLHEMNILQIIGLVAPEAMPGHSSAIMAFTIKYGFAQVAMEKISEIKGIVATACVSGRFDIMALVTFNESNTQSDFIFKKLIEVEGILSVETFSVLDSKNWQLRYNL